MGYRRITLLKEGVSGWRSDFKCAISRGKARWRQALISLGCEENVSPGSPDKSIQEALY
jgi:hypothetical protein